VSFLELDARLMRRERCANCRIGLKLTRPLTFFLPQKLEIALVNFHTREAPGQDSRLVSITGADHPSLSPEVTSQHAQARVNIAMAEIPTTGWLPIRLPEDRNVRSAPGRS